MKVCSIDRCGRLARARGLCGTHYNRRRRGEVNWDREISRQQKEHPESCTRSGCDRIYAQKGLCQMHYARLTRGADMDAPVRQRGPDKCTMAGCEKPHVAKGLCRAHYESRRVKLKNNGEPIRQRWGPVCSTEKCERASHAKGLCSKHYLDERMATAAVASSRQVKTVPRSTRGSRVETHDTELCRIKKCDRPRRSKGLCGTHYKRSSMGEEHWDRPIRARNDNHNGKCSYHGCERKYLAHGYCSAHYQRNRFGAEMETPIRRVREIGETRVNKHGYVQRKIDDASHRQNQNWELEHRIVMEQALNRKLYPGESVHHKNGIRSDNRIDNLELWSTALTDAFHKGMFDRTQPSGQRVKDITSFCEEFLFMHKPNALLKRERDRIARRPVRVYPSN